MSAHHGDTVSTSCRERSFSHGEREQNAETINQRASWILHNSGSSLNCASHKPLSIL
jgi:hypothetical protein